MTLRCHGCAGDLKVGDVHPAHAEGHEAHYCLDCHDEYTQWVAVCGAEEARLNRLLDVFIEESRERLGLRFVPQDLPPITRSGRSTPLVLG